jgi:hypothetical protein
MKWLSRLKLGVNCGTEGTFDRSDDSHPVNRWRRPVLIDPWVHRDKRHTIITHNHNINLKHMVVTIQARIVTHTDELSD